MQKNILFINSVKKYNKKKAKNKGNSFIFVKETSKFLKKFFYLRILLYIRDLRVSTLEGKNKKNKKKRF